jgi:ATP-dependent Lon protease
LHLAYIAAAHSEIKYEKRQALLEEDSLRAKFRELLKLLSREKEILSLGNKIKFDVQDEMNKSQRNYYLKQQLKAIKKELGEQEENQSEPDDYQQRIAASEMSNEARDEAMRELARLEEMSPQSAEYWTVKTYLDWLLELPWNRSSEDQTDVDNARDVLDNNHFGLQGVKDRIIEYLAVRSLLAIRQVNKKDEVQSQTSADVVFVGEIFNINIKF